jgi:regulatory protein
VESKNRDLLQKAKNYAFLLLKFRLRSREEIRQRLRKKKFDPQVIEETLAFLEEKKFIDDNYFAKAWIESRLKKPLGIRRLRAELGIKGIAKEIIEARINEAKDNYPEEEIVAQIVREKLEKTKGIEPQKAKQRIYAYLLRRGFSPETVVDTLNQLTK